MHWTEPRCFAVKHREPDILAESQSGGIFTALSDVVLQENGVIYGCALVEDLRVAHIRAETAEERNKMRGSKYVQSSLGNTFKDVEKDLRDNRKVLFSGTSCQIAGLRGFLKKDWPNLLCVDILCHGVPSPKVWEAYWQWQENQVEKKIVAASFRNKKVFGWRTVKQTVFFEDGTMLHNDIFARLFYDHNALRPSCYFCPYKSTMHPGDITIADYWGIEKAAPEFDDEKGTSLVLVNNHHGQSYFEKAKNMVIWKETSLSNSMQLAMIKSYEKPAERDRFWKDLRAKSFEKIIHKYCGGGIVSKIKRKVRITLQRIKERM